MGNVRKNVFHIYKSSGYIDKPGIEPLYPGGVRVHRGNSFQVMDPEPRIKIIQMPGIRKGAIKMPLETIARLIEEKLLEYSGNYNPATGSALQLQDVSEDGSFTFIEFYQGEKTLKTGGWVEKDGSVKVIINNKQIN